MKAPGYSGAEPTKNSWPEKESVYRDEITFVNVALPLLKEPCAKKAGKLPPLGRIHDPRQNELLRIPKKTDGGLLPRQWQKSSWGPE